MNDFGLEKLRRAKTTSPFLRRSTDSTSSPLSTCLSVVPQATDTLSCFRVKLTIRLTFATHSPGRRTRAPTTTASPTDHRFPRPPRQKRAHGRSRASAVSSALDARRQSLPPCPITLLSFCVRNPAGATDVGDATDSNAGTSVREDSNRDISAANGGPPMDRSTPATRRASRMVSYCNRRQYKMMGLIRQHMPSVSKYDESRSCTDCGQCCAGLLEIESCAKETRFENRNSNKIRPGLKTQHVQDAESFFLCKHMKIGRL